MVARFSPKSAARRFYGVRNMMRPDEVLGEIPSTRDAYRRLFEIAWPALAELVLMSLIGSIDTMMVGGVSKEAVAAVSLTGQPRMLLLAVFFALNTGVTAIVARRKGEDRQAEANRTLRNAIVIALGLSVLVAALGYAFARPLMLLAEAQPDTIDESTAYFRILTLALPINALTMCINAAQRGVGKTRITMYVNVVSNVVNVICNFLLIGGNLGFPRLEVRGAAIATVIGFMMGFSLCVYSLVSPRLGGTYFIVRLRDDWRLKRETLMPIARVGSNAILEQIVLRIGFFLYARNVAQLGTAVMAAHAIDMQFLNITFSFGDGLAVAGTALVGMMLGQKRPDLAKMYGRISQKLALTISLTLFVFLLGFRTQLVQLFLENKPENAETLAIAANVMIIVALFQPFQTSSVVLSGCLRGAGDTRYVAIIMTLCVGIIRPGLSWIAINWLGLGIIGAWSSALLDMALRLTLVHRRYESGKWCSIKV